MHASPLTLQASRDDPPRVGMRLARLAIALAFVVWLLFATGQARAVVVDMNAVGQAQVAYNPADQSGYYGVALVPGSRPQLAAADVPTVTSSGSCSDPWLSSDLLLPPNALCWHGRAGAPSSAVMHASETFAITWDPHRAYWQTTRGYVEQFLRDVADGSGTLSSPYAVTTQYNDQAGRAANASVFGGACIDYGAVGGSACDFGSTNGSGAGNDYPASGCPVTSYSSYCLTDAQLRSELTTLIGQTGVAGHAQPGHTPLLVVLTPLGVQDCLDAEGTVCSVNGASAAQFCSYHSYVAVGGAKYAYVVLPWTTYTGCDETNLPALPSHPTARQVAIDAGSRLVSPLSQGQIAAIVNPWMNAWFASDGSEINDNDLCGPEGDPVDAATVGASGQNPYYLQREFNNAGVIQSDPNGPPCSLEVALSATFVPPSAVNPGDEVQFDGSTTVSSLIVPRANYRWNFGDGTTSIGPSVVHLYAKGGSYTVLLTVTDRGGTVSTFRRPVVVLGPKGQPGGPAPGGPTSKGVLVRLKLIPQGLRAMLRAGLAVRITSNVRSDGILTLSLSRAQARRAHLRAGPGPAVVVGRGTISGVKAGTVTLHLRFSRAIAARLRRLGHVTLTVRLALFAAGGKHIAVDVAGRYL
jgi:PKD domain